MNKLQLYIPNSISTELKNATSHDILSPLETQRKLKDKKISLKTGYADEELNKITSTLKVDAFVYGAYSVNRQQYLINTRMYLPARNQILSLQVEGRLGQSISSTIRVIRTHLFSFLKSSPKYLSEKIIPGKKVCFISNLPTHEQNELAIAFLKKGYQVCALGYTDFNYFSANETVPFYSMQGQGTAIDSVFKKPDDFEKFELTIASTRNSDRIKLAEKEMQLRLKYGVYYQKTKLETLKRVQKHFNSDYLLVFNRGGQKADKDLGFDVSNKETFLRGLNLQTGQLVYAQDKLSLGTFSSGNLENQLNAVMAELQKAPEIKKESLKRGRPRAPQEGQETPQEEKALVGILNFYDRTNTNSYTWMSTSLADAINKSMLQVFEFNRAEPESTQRKADAILKGSSKVDQNLLKAVQKATALDYIVLGSYTYNSSNKKITVSAAVYDLYSFEKIGEALATTETDVRLFSSVDVVAQKIVKDIFKFAAGQDSGDDDKKAPARQLITIKKGIIKGEAATMSVEEQANLIEFERYKIDWLSHDDQYEKEEKR